MKKTILNLGKRLSAKDQKSIIGGMVPKPTSSKEGGGGGKTCKYTNECTLGGYGCNDGQICYVVTGCCKFEVCEIYCA